MNKPNNLWNSTLERISYFFNVERPYETHSININKTEKWMDSNIIVMFIFAILNMYCLLWTTTTGTYCISKKGFKLGLRRNSNKKV